MKISIIVPVYKVEKYLSACIESVLAQTYPDWELLLIDDGSPDGCPAICDEYAQKDSRIRAFHINNGGPGHARNAGLDNAKGEFVFFLDSDDLLTPNALEEIMRKQVETNVDFIWIYPYPFVNDSDIDAITPNKYSDEVIDNVELCNHLFDCNIVIGAGGKLIRRSKIGNNRFNELLKTGEDVLFNLECAHRTKIIATHSSHISYLYRVVPSSLTHSDSVKACEWKKQYVSELLRIYRKWNEEGVTVFNSKLSRWIVSNSMGICRYQGTRKYLEDWQWTNIKNHRSMIIKRDQWPITRVSNMIRSNHDISNSILLTLFFMFEPLLLKLFSLKSKK